MGGFLAIIQITMAVSILIAETVAVIPRIICFLRSAILRFFLCFYRLQDYYTAEEPPSKWKSGKFLVWGDAEDCLTKRVLRLS